MRTSTKYWIALIVVIVFVITLISVALINDRIDILAEFLGVLLGFLLAYVAIEGLRCRHAEREADQILTDVEVELEELFVALDEPELYSFTSATGSWIKSQGLTYVIPRDIRKKVLDVFTTLQNYNSMAEDSTEYEYRSDCDAGRLAYLETVLKEKEEELRKEAKLALDAIKNR